MDWNAVNASAAWWGAIIATVLGIIKFHQWWTQDRPKFSIRLYKGDVLSDKKSSQGDYLFEESVKIEIVNAGKDVVIQKVCIEEYPRRPNAFQHEYEWTVFPNHFLSGNTFELGEGKFWSSAAKPNFIDRYNQTKDKSKVFVTIYHAGPGSPYRQKTPIFIEPKEQPT